MEKAVALTTLAILWVCWFFFVFIPLAEPPTTEIDILLIWATTLVLTSATIWVLRGGLDQGTLRLGFWIDNYPEPRPCLVLERAGKLKVERVNDRINCEAVNCPFKKLKVVRDVPSMYCWIKGRVYNNYVNEVGMSLHKDMTRKQLVALLKALERRYSVEEKITMAFHNETGALELMTYLKTLLSIKEWKGKLIASY